MTELQQLLFHIKMQSNSLWMENETLDTLEIDTRLGIISGFIDDARLDIDLQWKAARARTADLMPKPKTASTLEDLL